jgi:hypothetical protein
MDRVTGGPAFPSGSVDLVAENLRDAARMVEEASGAANFKDWQRSLLSIIFSVKTISNALQNLGLPEASNKLEEASRYIPRKPPRTLQSSVKDEDWKL